MCDCDKAKQKYRGMFETQKSGNQTSSGEICHNFRKLDKHLSKSGTGAGVRRSKRPLLACRTRCKCYMETSQLGKNSNSVIRSRSLIGSKIGVMPDQWRVSL